MSVSVLRHKKGKEGRDRSRELKGEGSVREKGLPGFLYDRTPTIRIAPSSPVSLSPESQGSVKTAFFCLCGGASDLSVLPTSSLIDWSRTHSTPSRSLVPKEQPKGPIKRLISPRILRLSEERG